jgi:hypothetical protein
MRRPAVLDAVVLLILAVLHLTATQPVGATPLCVGGGDCYATIQAAVTAASDGDTITVAAGTYFEHVSITKALTLLGAGAGTTIIDGGDTDVAVHMNTPASSTTTITGFTIQHGHAWDTGGGVLSVGGGGVTLTNDVIADNRAAYGNAGLAHAGGIHSTGPMVITGSTITRNSATGNAGAIYLTGTTATATITDTTISDNISQAFGAVFNEGTMNLLRVTVSGNTLAGIDNRMFGTLTVSHSLISTNSGGGITNAGSLTLTDSTIAGNMGRGIGNGYSDITHPGTATITNCTIVDNHAPTDGGGIYATGPGPITTTNTIIAQNTAGRGPDAYGDIGSAGYNLIGNPDYAGGFLSTDLLNVDPLLGPLQDNGGATLTYALLLGSPAIDAIPPDSGCGVGITTDQRGIARPRGLRCDIGAVEFLVTLASLSNALGPTTGGSTMILHGDNFGSAATVLVGGSTAAIQSVGATQIVVSTPAHAAGTVDVSVTTSGQTAALPGAYTYVAVASLPVVKPSAPSSPPLPDALPPQRPTAPSGGGSPAALPVHR